ncbi:3-deoxy-7-phosphoheptulonate synthase [Roseibacillus ishigakijimensis]|uniref:Phospho-2-dehydro-3-deoxyheptonate aldolase n=1 Tax=Roseibacillus ishigakijimensis TaxID=454146 RepID=A0A934VLV7_9BACT|nr:3-deoxy-7-phosphoheptulonate synthase [Roseibacillus ishigakijimensis]MBK1833300.1 3-deoxy-7-phosphoheptulonate synthase [Roseibacillus ishigakijimensis]
MSTPQTDDLRIQAINPLVSPAVLNYYLPITPAAARLVADARQQATNILHGKDDRLLVVIGPCSIHDPKAAVEYGEKLKPLIDQYADDLQIVMRVYFEKPRTTVGWKGLINDPHLDGSFDINRGLRVARGLLLELAEKGIPAGTEFLDTISPQYIADLIAWGAIGARTTESQIHRELASGLSMPVGFKNGTGGSVQLALDAIGASSKSHHFLSVTKQGVSAIVCTTGNDACHIILRGGSNGPNYDADSIAETVACLQKEGLPPHLMVDCSHGNSNKDYRNQPKVVASLAEQIAGGSTAISSVMIESNLVEDKQSLGEGDLEKLTYGQSVTDACIGWETTGEVLATLAQAVRQRRQGQ